MKTQTVNELPAEWREENNKLDLPRIKEYPPSVIFWERIGATFFMMLYFGILALAGLHGERGFGVSDHPGVDVGQTTQGALLLCLGAASIGFGILWIIWHVLRRMWIVVAGKE